MLYTSRKKGFKNFIKSRNNLFYIGLAVVFIAVITVTAITLSRRKTGSSTPIITSDSTSLSTKEDSSTITQTDTTGMYYININLADCVVYVKEDENGDIIKKMPCSIYNGIKEGNYAANTSSLETTRLTWYDDENGIYRFYTNFGNGIAFHSAGYKTMLDKNSLIVDDYNKIGSISEIPGITLCVNDAKWIYEHCSANSVIKVFSDSSNETGPEIIQIPDGITWDPTDNSDGSPWSENTIKELKCPENLEFTKGISISDIKKFILAYDTEGNDISNSVQIQGIINFKAAGTYEISCVIADKTGNFLRKNITIKIIDETEDESTKKEEEDVSDAVSDVVPDATKETSENTSEVETTKTQTTESQTTETTVAETQSTEDVNENTNLEIVAGSN